MVDASAKRDVREASVYEGSQFYIPKVYMKMQYCSSCAIHAKIVAVRSVLGRKERFPIKKRKTVAELQQEYKDANML